MTLLKKSTSSLSNKLKGAVTDLSIDIFGYEKMITKNIISHTNEYAKRLHLPLENLHLKILQNNGAVRAYLCNKETPLLLIPTEELALFFISPGLGELSDTGNKINSSIMKYLKEFSKKQELEEKSVRIWIRTKGKTVDVFAFEYGDFLETVSLNSLIKFFKK